MRDWHADDLAFLAAVIFALSSLPIAFAAIAIAVAMGSPGIIGLVAAVCAYGVLTELHVRRRMRAGTFEPVPTPRASRSRFGILPRQGQIHFSLSAHLEWSVPGDEQTPSVASQAQIASGLTMDLDWTTGSSPAHSGQVSGQIEVAPPGQISGDLVAHSEDNAGDSYRLEWK